MDQNLCFEYQQLMSRYNIIDKQQHRQLELKKNDSQHQQQQIKKEKLSKEFKNNNLKVEELPAMPTQHHHRLNLSNLFKNIKPAPVSPVAPVAEAVAPVAPVAPVAEAVAPVAEAVAPVAEVAMKNKILFKSLQQIMLKK